MAHSGDPHATMFAHYQPGSTSLRNLTSDDISGICSVYPPDKTRTVSTHVIASGKLPEEACDPTPRHGFGTSCATPQDKGCTGNTVAMARAGESRTNARGTFVVSLMIGAIVFLRSWRRTDRKRSSP
jgi:hypothetical protein